MLHSATYQLKPYLLIGEPAEKYIKPGTEWVRNAVKGLMHSKSGFLKGKGVRTELFHNHNELTGKTLTGYPKILYHYTNESFLVTGINEGATALGQLFELYPGMIRINGQLIIGISKTDDVTHDDLASGKVQLYRIKNYLPFNASTHKLYLAESLPGKMKLLEDTMKKHFRNDLFKFLEINVPELELKLIDILKLDQKRLSYKNHQYLPFDLVFSLNIDLPQYLALGNGKAFGYGIIERYFEP
jgi:hypothetical protein